jgi:hypothetical protein
MGEYVTAVWGWDDDVQRDFFDRRWQAGSMRVLLVRDERVGAATVDERPDELGLRVVGETDTHVQLRWSA